PRGMQRESGSDLPCQDVRVVQNGSFVLHAHILQSSLARTNTGTILRCSNPGLLFALPYGYG
ncbi:MAG: hypothetical protein AB2535_20965, partial [Candidatus Thiodiazotropha endolucinida]